MTSPDQTRLICPLTASTVEGMLAELDRAVRAGADCVELRLDYLEKVPDDEALEKLLSDRRAQVIVTCRPALEGGRFESPEDDRLELLRRAANLCPDFIDVEIGVPRPAWPKGAIIHSHHDFHAMPEDLEQIAASLDASEAAVNKIAFASPGPQAALRALGILRFCHKPTMALAMGEAGVASRILAKKFGAFGTFAALDEQSLSAPGQPTVSELINLYRWRDIGPSTAVYGVIGCPIAHSMSPAVHNAAFAAAGIDAVYVPLRIEPGILTFDAFMEELARSPWAGIAGLSVTIPHKENALEAVGQASSDPLAVAIGAVNTIVIGEDGRLRGYNTDYAAAIDSLCDAMDITRQELAGRKVAVLGAGGAARAIVAGLAHYRAEVTIYNRTVERAAQLAGEFACRHGHMVDAQFDANEIIINCTPVGMSPRVDASPLEALPAEAKVVFDTIYNPPVTALLAMARRAGLVTVGGGEMFLRQAAMQFEIWTGRKPPVEAMRRVLEAKLGQLA